MEQLILRNVEVSEEHYMYIFYIYPRLDVFYISYDVTGDIYLINSIYILLLALGKEIISETLV